MNRIRTNNRNNSTSQTQQVWVCQVINLSSIVRSIYYFIVSAADVFVVVVAAVGAAFPNVEVGVVVAVIAVVVARVSVTHAQRLCYYVPCVRLSATVGDCV